jgi:hypothetical protein
LRNPGDADHRFRFMPIGDSDGCRSVIPVMPIADSGDVDQEMLKKMGEQAG